MAINALSYIGVNSDRIEDWSDYSQKYLGMQRVDRAKGTLSFRMDDQKQRLAITGDTGDSLAFIGWEVEKKEDLQTYATKLENNNILVNLGNSSYSDKRFVEELIYFNDPQGNRIELVYSPMNDSDPFKPSRPISGFKTGPLGMGHVVLHVKDFDVVVPFYRDLLGFKISDYSHTPISLCFFHVNGRHHSMALFGSGRLGFHHFMVEYNNLDDVGQGYDLIQYEDSKIAYTMGRHTNDYMTSFYSITPSGFFVENGWGGRIIDPNTWKPIETFEGPSFWGHERLYLSNEERMKFRKKRMETAAEGKQAPLLIDCPWLYTNIKNKK
tara:strand:- start:174 stop:1148 length:975 start_codon:yes stop_codon:yes gene_type:complete